jgi:hypothetical protein
VAFTHLGNYSQAIEIANQILKQDATNLGGLEVKGYRFHVAAKT